MTNDALLVFESSGPWPLLGAAALLLVLGWLSWLGVRRTTSRFRRGVLLALRGAIGWMLLMLILQPAWQVRQLTPLKSRVALLVDASESMGLAEGGKTRAQRAAQFLEQQAPELSQLQTTHELESYVFSGSLNSTSLEGLARRTDGDRTDLVSALTTLAAEHPSEEEDLAGVILISDGADTEKLSQSQAPSLLPESFKTLLSSWRVPVHTLAVGSDQGLTDLAIADVRFDSFSFIRNAVEVEARVSLAGADEMSIPVTLEESGRHLASTVINVRSGETRTAKLRFVPDRVGKFVYRVATPVLPGETILENNSRSFVATVIRDKIRVLHVVGRPSWDERFLRQALKQNPNVDLVSFFILRNTTDAPGVSQDELSLIPFPVDELFGQELGTFDVVLFQNFNHGPYQVSLYLANIANYVRDGGGFAMIGGDLSFAAGGYGQSPLEGVLPVRLRTGNDYRAQEFVAVPTPEGQRHPILDIGAGHQWDQFPALGSLNLAQATVEGAMVLLAHPFERAGPERAPVLSLLEVGRGRSAALLTDGSWRWNLVYAGQGGSPQPYHRFWNNLLHWLIRDPTLEALSLRATKPRYEPGEAVRLRVTAYGSPKESKATLQLQEVRTGEKLGSRPVVLDENGQGELEWPGLKTGAYRGRVELVADAKEWGKSEEVFVVEGARLELSQPAPRPELLNAIALATGGKAQQLERGTLSNIPLRQLNRFRIESSTTFPLLHQGWILAVLVVLLGTQWWLRRRWGLA